jgi:hypothetical protein
MYTIYALQDPRNFAIRYVGMTNNPNMRYFSHVSGLECSPKKNEWIKEVKGAHLMPLMEILDNAPTEEDARKKEAFWIHLFRDTQPPLTNKIYPSSTTSCSKWRGRLEIYVRDYCYESVYHNLLHGSGYIPCADADDPAHYPHQHLTKMCVNVYDDRYWLRYTRVARRGMIDRIIVCYRTHLPGCCWTMFGDEEYTKDCDLAISNIK